MVSKFRETTDELLNGVSYEDLARALGCSVASVKQARLREGARARRPPPEGWETVAAKLAESQVKRLSKLAAKLRGRDA